MAKKKPDKNALPGLLKKAIEPGANWEPGKISEMLIDFARPLLEGDPGGPPDIETLRHMMTFVSICWNVPILESAGNAELKKHLHLLDDVAEPLQGVLQQLIENRKTLFGAVPFLVTVEVRGTSLDDASVYAEARLPQGTGAS